MTLLFETIPHQGPGSAEKKASDVFTSKAHYESNLRIRSCSPTPTEKDDYDEYTLSAFGDISLDRVLFIPGVPSGLSPARTPRIICRPKRSRTKLSVHPLPSVIQNILPSSPSKPRMSSDEDFQALIENMKTLRASPSKMPQTAPPVPSARPVVAEHDVIKTNREINSGKVCKGLKQRPPAAPLPSPAISIPKVKERPLRGNARLPRRPPLPRWDLLDPAVYSKAVEDPGSLFGSVSGVKLYKRT